ncbi:hypothetical protein OIU77_013397 [Salix suchowensis]|uniref:Uncharacterized protein n=1 Tax=Salix suchowensis TaxID=1278906 RepID=A0ABQ8ZVC8_9ROSI|nr:hypothetical protein OIU77_013397 [Salix suchowensis]
MVMLMAMKKVVGMWQRVVVMRLQEGALLAMETGQTEVEEEKALRGDNDERVLVKDQHGFSKACEGIFGEIGWEEFKAIQGK